MKTNKAVAARFRLTRQGKLLKRAQGRRHLLSKKSAARKRRLGRPTATPAAQAATYIRMLRGL